MELKTTAGGWRRTAAWIFAGFNALTLLIVLGLVVLMHSERFHNYLLKTAQQKASEALRSQVQMQGFAFHLSGLSPTVDLYGVIVHGAAPYADLPLLQADVMHFGVTVTSLLHKSWYVGDVRIEHPVVRLFADSNGTNLPAPKSRGNSSAAGTSVFDLGIRHLLLERGEIYYNNRKSELSADLHDLTLQSSFELLRKSYSGTLSYRDGHLQLQNASPIGHNFDARFVATPEEFRLESADLRTANSRLSLVATVHNYSQPQVHATYNATLNSGEFRRALNNPSLPDGIVVSSGALEYDARAEGPLVASVNAQGEMHSARVTVTSQRTKIQIRNLGARYSLANGNAAITGIHAQLVGGTLGGTITTRDLGGSTRSHLSASLHGASLAALQNELLASSSSVTNPIALRGTVDATADATWGTTMQDLLARADATLQANVQPAQGGTATPVNGAIRARYAGKRGQLSFDQSYIRTSQTSVTLNGTISDHPALQARVNSNDLHELETIATAFQAPGSQPLGIHGHATLTATVSGSTRNPQVAGQVTADNLKLRGSEW